MSDILITSGADRIVESALRSFSKSMENDANGIYLEIKDTKMPFDRFTFAEKVASADGKIGPKELKFLRVIRKEEGAVPKTITVGEALRLGFDVAAIDNKVKPVEMEKRDEFIRTGINSLKSKVYERRMIDDTMQELRGHFDKRDCK